MKTPREIAHDGAAFDCPALGHFWACNRMTEAIAARDAEHAAEFARRTVPVVDVLRSISCWPLEKPCHCGQEMCRRARAALSLLLGETP